MAKKWADQKLSVPPLVLLEGLRAYIDEHSGIVAIRAADHGKAHEVEYDARFSNKQLTILAGMLDEELKGKGFKECRSSISRLLKAMGARVINE
jgi:hypothetical protein